MDFQTLRKANVKRDAEWDPEHKISLAFRVIELVGELGEACNVVKKLKRQSLGIRGSRSSYVELAKELADIVICVDLIAMHFGIDLSEEVKNKFNTTSEKYDLKTRIST